MVEKASVTRGFKLSGVWFIPLLALLLGAYMVVHAFITEGPEIEIAFKTASGLEPGKTRIKYRNVDMGVVDEVRLNDAFDGVIAKAKLSRQALPLLREDTRFWVVTARVGVGSVSGLDTLLSGAYIQLAPGNGKEGARSFVALEEPPLTPTGAPGLRLQLSSDRASSVGTGDSVLYKGYKVGRVENTRFDPKDGKVRYVIFIDAPYHELVNAAVRFWDVSGVSVSAGADGVQIEAGSIDTVLLGGIAFGLPEGVAPGGAVEHNAEFRLYDSYKDILKNPYKYGLHYVVSFSQSIRGLQPGAPVEYRGIPIGRVERIMMEEASGQIMHTGAVGQGTPMPVLIYIEPARLEFPDEQASIELMQHALEVGVQNGMRATLQTGNLLTGAQYVSIEYYEGVEEASLGRFLDYQTIPTTDTGLGQLQQKVSAILDMIEGLPLDDTVANVNGAVDSLTASLDSVNAILQDPETRALPARLEETLQQLEAALQGLSPGSETYQSLNSSLLRLNRTLGNIEAVTKTLASQPNAVLLPAGTPPDPEPEIRE